MTCPRRSVNISGTFLQAAWPSQKYTYWYFSQSFWQRLKKEEHKVKCGRGVCQWRLRHFDCCTQRFGSVSLITYCLRYQYSTRWPCFCFLCLLHNPPWQLTHTLSIHVTGLFADVPVRLILYLCRMRTCFTGHKSFFSSTGKNTSTGPDCGEHSSGAPTQPSGKIPTRTEQVLVCLRNVSTKWFLFVTSNYKRQQYESKW